jgi:elongator complex protein 3
MRRLLRPDEVPAEVHAQVQEWRARHTQFDPAEHAERLLALFAAIAAVPEDSWKGEPTLFRIVSRFAVPGKGMGSGPYSKARLVAGYHYLVAEGDLEADPLLLRRIRKKPMRTQSGVAPVTVLTAPAGCPAACIFCPDDARMPKSYIHDEPGCQRAEREGFDPYLQTLNRIRAFENIGHDAGKVELLILGGTWSAYSRDYRTWFVRRCLQAMNDAGTVVPASGHEATVSPPDCGTLAVAQAQNVAARHRNVGLVIETRPDWVTPDEIVHLRQLGVTKVQLGVQSLDDGILALNGRGHDVESVRRAAGLLRTAGFKIQMHWMPNLLGATLQSDRDDFRRLFDDSALVPDEIKIYPCALIAGTELHRRWQAGAYRPYTLDELVTLLADLKPGIPPWTRVNRLFRDIPAHHIQAGVTTGNLREVVQAELRRRGVQCGCLRCREVKQQLLDPASLSLRAHHYKSDLTDEWFLELVGAPDVQSPAVTAAYLRLSLPQSDTVGSRAFLPEIAGNAMVRELHVYGQALGIGSASRGEPQHLGLGARLLDEARRVATVAGYGRLSVIAATGTQGYYAARGFSPGDLYMHMPLQP